MADLSQLSDDELKALWSQQNQPQPQAAPTNLSSMSDADLKALWSKSQPKTPVNQADVGYGDASPWSGLENRTPDAEASKISQSYTGPTHGIQHGSDYSLESMGRSIPVAGALVQNTPELQQWEANHPGKATAMHVAGNVLGTAPLMMAAPGFMGMEGALGARAAAGALSSGTIEGADALAKGKTPEEAAKDAGWAAFGGGVTAPAAAAVGAVVSPTLQKGAQYLKDKGIPLTPGQLLGDTWQRFENVLESTPIVGTGVTKARMRSMIGFNRAALNDSLAEVGHELPENIDPGAEGRQYVRKYVQGVYDDATSKSSLTANPLNSPLINDINNAQSAATSKFLLPEQQQKQLDTLINTQIKNKLNDAGGVLNGDAIKTIDHMLEGHIENFTKAGGDSANLGMAIQDVRDAFMNEVKKQNPLMAQKMDAADAAWAKYSQVRRAGASTTGPGREEEGYFTPNQLAQASKWNDKSIGGRQTSENEALMQDLTRPANKILPNTMPDSHSPERIETAVLGEGLMTLLGHPWLGASVLGPPIAGRLAYTQPGQALARALIAGGQNWRQPIAQATTEYGPQLARALVASRLNQPQGNQ